jgi:methyltransferase family protein
MANCAGGFGTMNSEPELLEDLVDLAPFAFRVAQEMCGACRAYHAIWVYERLADIKGNTFDSERDILGSLIRASTRPQDHIMIAGAADAGLLAFVLREGVAPKVTVVDVCATPLAVCNRYAQSHGLVVSTAQQDLTKAPLAPRYDFVLAHNTLLHLAPELWGAFLRNLRLSLSAGGILLLVHSMRPQDRAQALPALTGYATRALAALAAKGISLPEDELSFRDRLESRLRVYSAADLKHLEVCLAEAGFAIARRMDHDRRKVDSSLKIGEVKPVVTHIFTAVSRGA